VEFRGISWLARHLEVDEVEAARRWLESPAVRSFERGTSDEEEFARGVCFELLPDWEPAVLREEIAGWIPGLLPGSLELVRDLRAAGVPASCLSNTNRLHWERMRSWGLEDALDHVFLSFRLGMVKPDPEIFDTVARTLDLPSHELLLLDDHPTNVEAARACGLRAGEVRGPREARSALEASGLLDGTSVP